MMTNNEHDGKEWYGFFQISNGSENKRKKPCPTWVFHVSCHGSESFGYYQYHIRNQRLKIHEYTKFEKNKR